MTRARLRLGAAGEDLAAAWYESNGYRILARNWRCREGEIDLVCLRDRVVVICEVKTRSSDAFGHPAEAVTPAKQQRLRVLAGRWLEDGAGGLRPRSVRFDVAAVLAGELDVIEAAF
ncbi:MAG: YraN family protein [Acidimicrobiales bacterium]|nr:YraN family protein [Acidimicrobiales bacterium]HMS89056.1 YraN family protein [Acidimicrobiales bacterium]